MFYFFDLFAVLLLDRWLHLCLAVLLLSGFEQIFVFWIQSWSVNSRCFFNVWFDNNFWTHICRHWIRIILTLDKIIHRQWAASYRIAHHRLLFFILRSFRLWWLCLCLANMYVIVFCTDIVLECSIWLLLRLPWLTQLALDQLFCGYACLALSQGGNSMGF